MGLLTPPPGAQLAVPFGLNLGHRVPEGVDKDALDLAGVKGLGPDIRIVGHRSQGQVRPVLPSPLRVVLSCPWSLHPRVTMESGKAYTRSFSFSSQ